MGSSASTTSPISQRHQTPIDPFPQATASQSPSSRRNLSNSGGSELRVELSPGFFVSEKEVRSMLASVSSADGFVTNERLKEYLSSSGLDATSEDISEMIRMLPQAWVSNPSHPETSVFSSNDTSQFPPYSSTRFTASTPYMASSYDYNDTPTASTPYMASSYDYNETPRIETPRSSSENPSETETTINTPKKLEELLWQSFLNYSFSVGNMACKEHILEPSDIEQRESYIFLAIPSLTFLEMISSTTNSNSYHLSSDNKYIKINNNISISVDTSPIEWKVPLEQIIDARIDYNESILNDKTLKFRLRLALAADPDEGISFESEHKHDIALNRIRGKLQGAATLLTQTDKFRDNFEEILELIGAMCAAR